MAELSPSAFGFLQASGPQELDPSAFGFPSGQSPIEPPRPTGGLVASAKQAIGSTIKGIGQAATDFLPGVTAANPISAYGQSVVDANPTAVQSLSDIADKPWTAVKEAVGNAGASMAGMLGARALGTGITAAAPFTGPAAPVVAGAGQLIANVGPFVAAALPSYSGIRESQIQSDPANEADGKSKAIALLGAGTVGAIEGAFGPQAWAMAAMKKGGIEAIAKKFADAKSLPSVIGKGIAHGAAVEGAEELVQNPIEQVAGYQDPTTRKAIGETLFGGAMGALGGGVLGGGMGGVAMGGATGAGSHLMPKGPVQKALDAASPGGQSATAEDAQANPAGADASVRDLVQAAVAADAKQQGGVSMSGNAIAQHAPTAQAAGASSNESQAAVVMQPQSNTPVAPEPASAPVSTAAPTAQTNQAEPAGVPTSPLQGSTSNGNQTQIAVPSAAGQQAQPAAIPAAPAVDSNTPVIQNRDRRRAASVAQMQSIAKNPDYLRLGPSRTPDSGAPMVFAVGDDHSRIPAAHFGNQDVAVMSDGQRVPFRYAVVDASQVEPSNFADGRVNPAFSTVANGTIKALNNGRTAGLRASYELGTAGAYQAELANDVANVGLSPDVVRRVRNPILVRVYSESENTNGMAAKSQAQGLGMSPGELAKQEATLLDSSILSLFRPGEVASADNRDFVRAFVGKLQQSGQDVAGMMTDTGTLSPTGRSRIQAALMRAAYGDADLVAEMFDSIDTDIKAIGEALKAVAGEWANMRDSARIGSIAADVDITGNLVAVVRLIQKSRRERVALFDLVNQRDIETGEAVDELTTAALRLFYTGPYLTRAVGKDRLTSDLDKYISGAMQTSPDAGLFGDRVTALDVLQSIITRESNDTEATKGGRKPDSSGAPGGGTDQPRTGNQRPGSDKDGQEPVANPQGIAPSAGSQEAVAPPTDVSQQDNPAPPGSSPDAGAAPAATLSYEEFAKQYRDAFANSMRYSPNEVGSTVFTERMAKLADDYPEFLARLEAEEEGKARPEVSLQGQTPEEIAASEVQAKAQAEKEAKAAQAEAKARKEAEDRAEIKRRSEAAAGTFELGGDALANLSGQHDIFAAPTDAATLSSEPTSQAGELPKPVDSAYAFLKSPDGSVDFGEITPAMAQAMRRQPGKIRLEQGDGSYGLQHIEDRHGAQIRSLGYPSVEDFVSDAVKHISSIWLPKKTSQMVALQASGKSKAVFIELKPSDSGDFYTVNTAFPVSPHYSENKGWKLLWSGASVPTVASGANPLAESPPDAGAATTMTPGQSSDSSVATPAAEGKSITDAKKEWIDAKIRSLVGLKQDEISSYDPKSSAFRSGRKWSFRLIGGNLNQASFDTRANAIEAAERYKQLRLEQYDHPGRFFDLSSLLAHERLVRIERYQQQGMTEMEAGRKANEEIPDWQEQYEKDSKNSGSADSEPTVEKTDAAKPDNTEDAGIELTYNRRNRLNRGLKWEDIADKNAALRVKEVVKSKVRPKPDYQTMIDGGMPPMVAHLVKQVYDAISVAPQIGGREASDTDLKLYIDAVNRIMDGVDTWANDKPATQKWATRTAGVAGAMLGKPVELSSLAAASPLLDSVYPGGWKNFRAEVMIAGGNKVLGALQPGYDEARRANRDIDKGWPGKLEAWQQQGYKVVNTVDVASVRPTNVDGQFYIEIDKRYHQSFPDRASAERALSELKPVLLLDKAGRIVSQHASVEQGTDAARAATKRSAGDSTIQEQGRSVEESERVGPARRMEGEDISSDKLKETFGFKGVNFGNWMKGEGAAKVAERQLHLNHAYDAFLDLAEILSVPSKAMSLNGMLGLAIGAQGGGKALAHFVPGVNEINLTRTAGAGALAHEWAHALDHYFATMAGLERQKRPYLTEAIGHPRYQSVMVDGRTKLQQVPLNAELRPEILGQFEAIVSTMSKRAQTQEEADEIPQQRLKTYQDRVDKWLKAIRGDLSRAFGTTTVNANEVRADALAKFDRLADRVRAQDFGDGKVALGRQDAISPVVSDIRDAFKALSGRVPDIESLKALQANIDALQYIRDQIRSGVRHQPVQITTNYESASMAADKGKRNPYWSSKTEMFARAFDAFVVDTLAKKASTNTYLAGIEAVPPMGEERKAINHAFGRLIAELKTRDGDGGNVVMYNVASAAMASPSDRAIYDMAREGKSAAEILSFIGKASRRPFNRYLANALARIGVSSSITLDSMGGWQFNQSKQGAKYAAAYNPKTDTVALFTPREAERHILHELIHAASLKAIANSGPAAMQMRALFRHIQKSGELAGQYGMSNLDEFVAEAFSNPKFQDALKGIAAPAGSKLKSAWQWFVRTVARILGLHPSRVSALDRAMTIGAELMRENAALAGQAQGNDRYALSWHGTPHVWEPEPGFPHGRPRLDKMGTGEGAQAYGWGWYSAEARDVGNQYRNQNTAKNADGTVFAPAWHEDSFGAVVALNESDGDYAKARSNLAKDGNREPEIKALDEMKRNGVTASKGTLYQLDIPDDVMPKLLDWDKRLSNQTPAVQDVLEDEGLWDNDPATTGQTLYEQLRLSKKSPKSASEYLASIGIPGLRYLDGQSRNSGNGTYNYVIWDQPTLDSVALLERNGKKLDAIREADAVRYAQGSPRLAPNGNPSNLNEHQWQQVRTPEFKAWFGDWELAAQSLRPAKNFSEAREAANRYQGKTLVSEDGLTATVSRNNLDKMLSASAAHKSESTAEHALAVANLDTLFAGATTGWTKTDRDGDPEISAIHRLFAPMQFDGKARLVKITVKEFARHGNRVYSVEAISVGEVSPVPEMVDADRANGSRLLTGPTGLVDSLVERIRNFNPDSVSKVVDANGEPLVVYHGTKADFNIFENVGGTVSSIFGNRKTDRQGFFFSDDDSVASEFAAQGSDSSGGGRIIHSYLSIKSPLELLGAGVPDSVLDTFEEEGVDSHWLSRFDWKAFDGEKGKKFVDAAKRIGYDGVIFKEANPLNSREAFKTYVAFDPDQIKSAIGNNGQFSPDNPDIRFNVAGTQPTVTQPVSPGNPWQRAKAKAAEILSPKNLDKIIYELQDKYVDLRRLRDHIRAIGGTITDLNDAYLGEELYHKRLAHRTDEFLKAELRPLLADMKARGVGMQDLETFLHARHAPEANAEMAKRNPNQEEIDAGQTKASRTVRNLELRLQRAKARGLATVAVESALNAARGELANWNGAQAFRGTEAERLSLSGMSDQEAATIMNGLTPERRADLEALAARVDAINEGTLQRLDDYGLMSKASLNEWRKTYRYYIPLHRDDAHPDSASHPIGQGFSIKGDAAKRRTGSNAEVTNILAHIAQQREAALTRGEKNHVMLKLYLMARQNPLADVWKVGAVPTTDIIDKATGFVKSVPDPLYRNRPNVLTLRIAGKDVAIVMNEHNPQALRMAQALKNLDVDDLHYIIPIVGKATRYFASINTQYNPIFGVINLMRDAQEAALNLSTTELAGRQKEVLRDALSILKEVIKNKGRMPTSGRWAALFNEFNEVGGTTGYRDLYLNAEDRAKALLNEFDALDRGKAKQAWFAVMDWLSDYNEAMENSIRLAAYKAALDNGMSKERAASLAKNLTVNFNRKGRQTRELGALYAFFNAAVQGTTRMAQTLSGPAGRKIMAGGVLVGAVNAMIGIAAMGGGDGEDDEWDKIPEFVKERSIIIPVGKQDYLSIPMPLGFQFLPNIGRLAVEMAVYKHKTLGKQMASLFTVLADAFNPLGGSSPALQIIAPTVMDPLVALAQNKDWTGKPIFIENRNSLDPEPGFKRSKDSATPWARGFAEAINAVTGGTEYTPGGWSPTPDQIDYVIGQLTGGLGREAGKVASTVAAPFTGEELPPYKIPLIGRLYGSTAGHSGQSAKFYENVTKANEAENEIKGRAKDGISVADYLRDHPGAIELAARGNVAEKQIATLRKIRHEAVKQDGPDKVAKVREVNERMAAVMRGFNRDVERMQ